MGVASPMTLTARPVLVCGDRQTSQLFGVVFRVFVLLNIFLNAVTLSMMNLVSSCSFDLHQAKRTKNKLSLVSSTALRTDAPLEAA